MEEGEAANTVIPSIESTVLLLRTRRPERSIMVHDNNNDDDDDDDVCVHSDVTS